MSLTSNDAIDLLHMQIKEWGLAKTNFEALGSVLTKEFDFDGFAIRVQFNPARIQSSAAKVDAKSIQERKCFLCPENLPPQQEGISYQDEYQVLVNPFPIFPQHFTIPTFSHIDQRILDRYGDMLDLAKQLDQFSLFYNGPKCGASAPDHAHFQAGNKGFMPIESDIKTIALQLVYKEQGVEVSKIKNYLRNGFLIKAQDRDKAVDVFKLIYNLLPIHEGEGEPMMNIITWYDTADKHVYSVIFPRAVHRPACYFIEGEGNTLISPASVDMGGVFITPLQKDFDKITKQDIRTILEEVSISEHDLDALSSKLSTILT
ncbi:MAG: hypothetical protein RL662_2295 [Bacteroidota bacterium]|jgi:hypothetical protein